MRTGTPIEMLTLFLLHPGKNNNVIPDTINIDRLALVLDSKKVPFTPIQFSTCCISSLDKEKHIADPQDEKVLSNRSPRRQNLDKKIGVIRQKKTSQQQVSSHVQPS